MINIKHWYNENWELIQLIWVKSEIVIYYDKTKDTFQVLPWVSTETKHFNIK
jgi:hypothetical protein